VGTHGQGDILRATKDYLPATRRTLEGLRVPDPWHDGRMPEKLAALRLLREQFGDRVLVTGSCAGPYSSAALLYGLQETMLLAMTDPELLAATCDFFVELQACYVEAQVEAGAHAVWLGDCNAYSSMLSLEQYKRFAFPSCAKLVQRAKAAGAIVYLHNSEISVPHLLAHAELGVQMMNCGPGPDAVWPEVRKALGGKICYSGNLDPIETLMRGTPEQVAAQTERIVRVAYPAGGYVFCTGEMNPRDIPAENMRAMVRAARQTAERL
jgi:uroporphyrinogen decarboxylase